MNSSGGKGKWTKKETQLMNKIAYVNNSSNNIQHHLKNSIEVELLMKLEDDGLGYWTISHLLNLLQEMNDNSETKSFYALENRKK